jgi:aldehyde dehydrogenase (NAD+)
MYFPNESCSRRKIMKEYGLYIDGTWVDSVGGETFESKSPTTGFEAAHGMRITKEEIFGPVLSVLRVRDYESAIEVANDVDYGLSSSIYTQNINTAYRAIDDLEAGITYINAPTIGAEVHLPFGGTKNTGNGGREAGTSAIEEFTEIKTVFIDYSGKLQKAQIQEV